MSELLYHETIEDNKSKIEFHPGNLIYCTDSKESYIDIDNQRMVVDNIVYINNETDKDALTTKYTNKAYYVKETNNAYKYDDLWISLNTVQDVVSFIFKEDEYVPSTLTSDGHGIAPRTLASAVFYNPTGESTQDIVDQSRLLKEMKVKIVVRQVTTETKVFPIPFPIDNYDLSIYSMVVLLNGYHFTEDMYSVSGKDLIVADEQPTLKPGDALAFIFSYMRYYDLNGNVIMTTKNYGDKSITTEKLADDIMINIRNINQNAFGRLVSDPQITNWDGKIDADKVYTKLEIDEKLGTFFESVTPETIANLNQLIDMLNSSGDVSTLLQKLNNVYTKQEVYTRNEIDTLLAKRPNFYTQNVEPLSPKVGDYWIGSDLVLKTFTGNGWQAISGAYRVTV